jgi:hypothetical protein
MVARLLGVTVWVLDVVAAWAGVPAVVAVDELELISPPVAA